MSRLAWENSGLATELVRILHEKFGFIAMTPVQSSAIPMFLGNKDVCVEACTGSGKTMCFLLPIFHKLLLQKSVAGVFAVILAPARELAMQIYSIAEEINEGLGNKFKIDSFIGGHSRAEDIEKLQSRLPEIIIATPGRLHDMADRPDLLSLKHVEMLVLDEADRLLEFGFEEKIHKIVDLLPKQRRTGLFSATMTTNIESLIKAGLRNPAYITVTVKSNISDNKEGEVRHVLPKGLFNYYTVYSNSLSKIPALFTFLLKHSQEKIIIFFATCDSTNYFKCILERLGLVPAERIYRLHGRMKQSQRDRVYEEFEKCDWGVLLATDLAARGIDIPSIDWIVQFDPPQNPDFFVHRVGRTARAGKSGKTLLFLLEHEESFIEFLQLRGVQLEPAGIDVENEEECYERIKSCQYDDREVYEYAKKAFVSYIRYYKEQHLKYIFNFKHLDIGYLAHSFSLLRIPRVQEILGKEIINFTQSDIDPDTITYKDKHKEKQRHAELEE